VSKRGPSPLPADISRREAKTTQGSSQHHNDHSNKNMDLEKYVSPLWICTFANNFAGQTILQTHLLPKLQKRNLFMKQR
jgi:hypothetical protein